MSTLSVPLTPALEKMIDKLIQDGVAGNKAELARKAIEKMAEDHAISVILQAEKELSEGKVLRGNLRDLAKKI